MGRQKTVNELSQEFWKILQATAHRYSYLEVFTDWAEATAISLHQMGYHAQLFPRDDAFERLETQYLELAEKYKREGMTNFAKMMGITTLAFETEKTDFLGQIYLGNEIGGKGRHGDFFTPYHVAKMMAIMTLQDVNVLIEKQGCVTFNEPACGAGGMLIAACDIIAEQGHHPANVMFFHATDINRLCFNMTYIQMSMMGIAGRVFHGNTLSNEMWDCRETTHLKALRHEMEPLLRAKRMVQALQELIETPDAKPADGIDGSLIFQQPEQISLFSEDE